MLGAYFADVYLIVLSSCSLTGEAAGVGVGLQPPAVETLRSVEDTRGRSPGA